MSTNGYIVRELIIRNFKAARKVTIYGAGPGVFEVTGANEAGKTSTLQALPALLAGLGYKEGKLKLWDGNCLTHGAIKGQLTAVLEALDKDGEAELDGLTITRKFTAENQSKGGSLVIKSADGSRRKQGDLNALVGEFSFDPTEWGTRALEEQVNSLNALVDPEVAAGLAELDASIDKAEQERRDVGRQIKTFGQIPDLPQVEPMDADALLGELERVQEHNAAQDRHQQQREAYERELMDVGAQIADLEARLDVLRRKRDAIIDRPLPTVEPWVDIKPIQQRLAEAGEQNVRAEQWRANEAKRAELSKLTRRHAHHDQEIEDLREARRQLALQAKVPIDGLEWGAKGVVWNGTPWAKLSDSQRLRLTAMIEMARHPQLRVMLIRNGDLLDDNRFKELRQLADEQKYQIWVESVRGARTDDAIEIVLGEYGQAEPWE